MSFELSSLLLDPKAEAEGSVVDLGDGGKIRIRHINHPVFKRALRRGVGKYRARDIDSLPEAKQNKILAQSIADGLLIGWEDVTENGEPLEFNMENVLRILMKYPSFVEIIIDEAQKISNFQDSEVEELSGN